MRLMSVSLTEQQVRDQAKTVTRRLGWLFARVGNEVTLCRKVMGRRPGEPLVRICDVEIVEVRREPLWHITHVEVTREGFPGQTPEEFVAFFTQHMRCDPRTVVTRIEWRYLPDRWYPLQVAA